MMGRLGAFPMERPAQALIRRAAQHPGKDQTEVRRAARRERPPWLGIVGAVSLKDKR